MKGTHTGIVLVVVSLLLVTGSKGDTQEWVKVDGTTVTLICSSEENPVTWWKINEKDGSRNVINNKENIYNISDYTMSKDGTYECKGKGEHVFKFYLRVKVCVGCFDLNTGTVIGIICGDLLVTFLVALSVYCFAKRKGAASKDYRHQQIGAQDLPLGRGSNIAPSHQQSEYAPIKSGQRDLYDKLHR
ncbi:T-cell surface glycoprotein CD3 epsilon chain-like [Carcharodon carcharias]|uniref:T-cell surface glycoprotein CD3 epsilon chain-like n=1 Tax=Carcharodon carcharias TaxID=13397 RepID=UPI001B7F482A|nr:T-cell surface glycoprotein CD3 epsilon chain-like [Carcharodon carcharias]